MPLYIERHTTRQHVRYIVFFCRNLCSGKMLARENVVSLLSHFGLVCVQMLVIDEADEMLNKGFKEQIYDIYRYLPPSTQVVLISATMPQEVLDMTKKFMNMPVKILVKRDELTLEGIKQVSRRPRPPTT